MRTRKQVEDIIRGKLKRNIDKLTHLSEEARETLLEQEVQQSLAKLDQLEPPELPRAGATWEGFIDSGVDRPDFE